MAEFASKGVAGTALGLGIAGTVGLINQMNSNGNGLLGNILGGNNNQTTGLAETMILAQAINGNRNSGCSENTPATRYDIEQSEKMASKDQRIAILESENFTNAKIAEFRDRIDVRFSAVEKRVNDLEQYTTLNTANQVCVREQIAQLMGITKLIVPSTNVCKQDTAVVVTNTATNPVYTQSV